MKINCLGELEEYQGEYPILGNLYNKWYTSIRFLSNFSSVRDMDEWKEIVKYCKEHKEETISFTRELAKINGNPYHFMNIVVDAFGITLKDENGNTPYIGFEHGWKMLNTLFDLKEYEIIDEEK